MISGCETLAVLGAAHIILVSFGGNDEASNGIPLRADLHRLFDAGLIAINAQPCTLSVGKTAGKYCGAHLGSVI
jgi:predicted restriction endonuclease